MGVKRWINIYKFNKSYLIFKFNVLNHYFFKAYIVDQDIRKIIETKDFQALQTNPTLTILQFKAVAKKYREVIPVYIKDYIKLEQFAA